ncbi:MAG: hypothetical protein WCD70_09740, partial [Alphaproteobacteria bacterium]
MTIIKVPDDFFVNAHEQGHRAFHFFKPVDFELGNKPVVLELGMTGRKFEIPAKKIAQYDVLKGGRKELERAELKLNGEFDERSALDDPTAYYRCGIRTRTIADRSPVFDEQKIYLCKLADLKPVTSENLPDAHLQTMTLPRMGFYCLFFKRASEMWLAEKEGREPMPEKYGSIRFATGRYTPGTLRIVEIDAWAKPTGWETTAQIPNLRGNKSCVWEGPLEQVPERMFRASGFSTRTEA